MIRHLEIAITTTQPSAAKPNKARPERSIFARAQLRKQEEFTDEIKKEHVYLSISETQ